MIALISTGRHDLSYLKPIEKLLDNCILIHREMERTDTNIELCREILAITDPFRSDISFSEITAIVVVGDRIEVLAICTMAVALKIPIAHIHGGEETLGAIDNKCRHAISQLATWHFCANQDAFNRLVAHNVPGDIWVTGSPAMDLMFRKQRTRKRGNQIVLIYHPTTLGPVEPLEEITTVVQGVEAALQEGQSVLMLGANPDAGGATINAYLQSLNKAVWRFQDTYESETYWDILSECYCLVGNSSSGIIEAPALQVPSINIGIRQQGRTRSPSVTDVPVDADKICHAIKTVQEPVEPYFTYGKPGASATIANVLKGVL